MTVTIVAGPPLAGKTKYVADHARSNDLLWDFDRVHAALSGLSLYRHDPTIKTYTMITRDAVLNELENHKDSDAWIITATPRIEQVQDFAKRFNAQVVVLMVDREEAHRRSDADQRPAEWHSYIDAWFDSSNYSESDFQERSMSAQILIAADEIERRSFTSREIRAIGDSSMPKLAGYAAVFNSLSDDLGGFYERIKPGAFTKTLTEADVRALNNHNQDIVLGRTRSGTLRLNEDETGLAFELDLPDTQAARDLITSVKRGDIDQMSFAFRTIRDSWEQIGEQVVRTLLEVQLFDISPVSFPAYPQTSASVRSKFSEFQQVIPSVPGQAAHPDHTQQVQAQVHLGNLRRKLDLTELL